MTEETNTESLPEAESPPAPPDRYRASSHGKRLFGLLIDLVFVVLLLNTLDSVFRVEHWDLRQQGRDWWNVSWFYGGLFLYLLLRDLWPEGSLGKRLLGMGLRCIEDLHQTVPSKRRFQRNLSLLLFPWEVWEIFRNPYGRRWGDRFAGTVVIDRPQAMRPVRRLLLANLLFFSFFILALGLQQPNMRKTAAYQQALAAVEADPLAQELLAAGRKLEEPEMHLDFRDQPEDSRVRFRINLESQVQIFEVVLSLDRSHSQPKWVVQDLETQALEQEGPEED